MNALPFDHPARKAASDLYTQFKTGYAHGYFDRLIGLDQRPGSMPIRPSDGTYEEGWLDADGTIEIYLEHD